MNRCRHCGLPLTWYSANQPLRDGTTVPVGYWYHYDLVFETECGIDCADAPGMTAQPVPSRWYRLRHPLRYRASRSDMTFA